MTVEWAEFFKELDEVMAEFDKQEKAKAAKEQKEKEEKEAKEKAKAESVAIPAKRHSEHEFYKELADAAATPIIYLRGLYLRKGFSHDEAFTLAVETYKIYATFMLNAALGGK